MLVQCPTGFGKTVMASSIAQSSINKEKRALLVVHRTELVDQSYDAFTDWRLNPGIIAAGYPGSRSAQVQIAMVQTLARRLDLFDHFDLIMVDEAHHSVAGTWDKILARYTKAVVIGLTATPERLDGKGLGTHYDDLVCGPSVRWLIDNKMLSEFRLLEPPTMKPQEFHLRAGEFIQSEVLAAVDNPVVYGDAVSHYLQYSAGERCISFCVSLGMSRKLVDAYRDRGVPAAHVDGETDKAERKRCMQDFHEGRLLVLSNVGLFSEGVNVPNVQTVQLLAPTASLTKYLQSVGRALRYVPGKTATILDHVGNKQRHGWPDAEREWSLEGRKKKGGGQAFLKQCKNCYAANALSARECSNCGEPFPVAESREIEQVDGNLIEGHREIVTTEQVQDMIKKATTMSDWHAIAKLTGRKPGWAWHQFNNMIGRRK